MRALDSALKARLESGATTLCSCWRIDRRDGRALGFTDHDAALSFDGVTFEAASAVAASALEAAAGLAPDGAEIAGALRSDAIDTEDVARGLFDGATVRRWLVDWRAPDVRALMFSGAMGEISQSGGRFRAQVEGLASALNRPLGRAFMAACDASLGDMRCGVDADAPAYRGAGTVTAVEGDALRVDGLESFAPGWFARGRLIWTSGANAGFGAAVREDAGGAARRLSLWVQPHGPVAVGDGFEIVAGCDKRAATCREKFSNFINFRGFPHMPGDDWITAYPAAGETNDGGSLHG